MVTYNKKALHLYKQCLVDILAGVLLASSCCVVPESTGSSLLVLWSLNYSSAASSSELNLASFKTPALEEAAAATGSCSVTPSSHRLLLGFTEKLPVDFVPTEVTYVVPSCKTPLQ